jgi:cytochrome c peroxidase
VSAFKGAYTDGLQSKNIQSAIAEFQRTLATPNSKFDKYLRGDKNALNADEQKGYQLFKNYGCIACHQGVNVGGNMYQVFGVMGDYFKQRGNMTEADLGRYNVTKNDADKHMFKVPSLRNVAVTAPYFHDGSVKTLPEAVEVMFRYQLGRSAPQSEKDLIVKFLQTLTGEYKGKSLDVASK